MKFEVLLSPEAQQDVKSAFDYIAEHGPANPHQWKAGLDTALASLEMMPRRCSLAPESSVEGETIHQLNYASYRILFVVDEKTVLVIAMWHGARLQLTKQQKDERLERGEES